MKLDDIKNYNYQGIARGIVEDLNNNINGRVALNDMLQSLYEFKSGDVVYYQRQVSRIMEFIKNITTI